MYNNKILFLTMLTLSMQGMEQEERASAAKRIKTDAQVQPVTLYQPFSLAHYATQAVLRQLPHSRTLLEQIRDPKVVPTDVKDRFISPALLQLVREKLSSTSIDRQEVTNPRFDSQCYFCPGAQQIVSLHASDNRIDRFELTDIRNDNFGEPEAVYSNTALICYHKQANACYSLETVDYENDGEYTHQFIKYDVNTLKWKIIKNLPGINGNYEKIFPAYEPGAFIITALNKPIEPNWHAPSVVEYIDEQANVQPVLMFYHPYTIKQLYGLPQNQALIIYTSGEIDTIDYENRCFRKHYDAPSVEIQSEDASPGKPANPIHVTCTALNPSRTVLSCGFTNNTLRIYNLAHDGSAVINPNNENPATALGFINETDLISAHNTASPDEFQYNICLNLWDTQRKIFLADCTQHELRGCNSIDISQDKKHMLLGMQHFDVALQQLAAFSFDVQQLDPEKMYEAPEILFEFLKPKYLLSHKKKKILQPLTFLQKLNFVKTFLKDPEEAQTEESSPSIQETAPTNPAAAAASSSSSSSRDQQLFH